MVRIRTKALMFSIVLVSHWSVAALAQEAYSGDPSLPFTESAAGVAHFEAFDSYVRFSHLMGDAIGHTSNYTQLGAFTPFFQEHNRLWFVDAQMIATNDSRLAANLGYGVRHYVEEWDRVFGFSVWYDVDDGRDVTLHQTGLSLETYGPWGDVRLNVDLPLTNQTKTRFTSLTNTRFSGGNILSDRTQIETTALAHIELMVGGAIPLPWLEDPSLRGYLGYYYLDGLDSPSANGILGRLEGYTTPDLSFHFTVRNDAINKTSALFGLTWVFPGRSTSRGSTTYDPARRLALPVPRDYRVAVNHVETMQTIVAMSSSSMTPITVGHVDSSGAAGGAGTFESPFNSFTDLAGSGGSFDLIVVAADSVFNNESITLTDNQRLLGQAPGLLHQVNTPMGMLTLT